MGFRFDIINGIECCTKIDITKKLFCVGAAVIGYDLTVSSSGCCGGGHGFDLDIGHIDVCHVCFRTTGGVNSIRVR